MNEVFEKILNRLDTKKQYFQKFYEADGKTEEDEYINKATQLAFDDAKQIVQEVAEEYSYLSKGFNNGLLKRIADYFSSVYEGDDKTAPKMELSVYDLRYIASLNVEKCRLQTEINNIKKSHEKYNNGWIACSERLPEESGTYIVNAIENSIIHVTFAKWMPRMKKWNLTGCRSYWKVNAWQPLPEPFKERD